MAVRVLKRNKVGKNKGFTTTKVRKFKYTIDVLRQFINEARFEFTKSDTIRVQGMDPANVAMVIFLTHGLIDGYSARKTAIDLDTLYELFIKRQNSDRLNVEWNENNWILTFIKDERTPTFKIKTLDEDFIESTPSKVPELKYPFDNLFCIDPMHFYKVIYDAKKVDNHLKFTLTKKKLTITAESDMNKYYEELKIDEEGPLQWRGKKPDINKIVSKYSAEYLYKFLRPAKKFKSPIQISIKEDYPLELVVDDPDFMLTFILAPRVDN